MNGSDLKYDPNPKHKEPWQKGRKGVLCPLWSHSIAQELLAKSVADPTSGKARYATRDGLAFKAFPDGRGSWHGFPVGWNEVPDKLRNQWLKEGLIKHKDVRKYKLLKTDEKGSITGE